MGRTLGACRVVDGAIASLLFLILFELLSCVADDERRDDADDDDV